MHRRTLIALSLLPLAPLLPGCAAVPPPGSLDASDRAVLSRVQVYLDAIHTLRARFVQVSADGDGTGTAWIERPGRLRLQYDPPSRALLVAARGRVVFASGTGATSGLPLARTPLSILLAPRIALSGTVTVVSVRQAGPGEVAGLRFAGGAGGPGAIEVTLRSTEHPGQGQLSLLFSDSPLALCGLVLLDGRGDTTRLSLSDLQTGVATEDTLFGLPGA